MLPSPIKEPFSKEGWIFEPKWDGYRALCIVENKSVRFISRNGRDLSKRFRDQLGTIHHAIQARSAVLDGEIVALDKEGMPCFKYLQTRAKCIIQYFAFDLLELNGNDLRQVPLLMRKEALRTILNDHPRVVYTDHILEDGEKLFKELERRGLEGMVCKKADSLYVGGRSKLWLKVKTKAGKAAMQKRIETWGHG